jgi:hypothetical protein
MAKPLSVQRIVAKIINKEVGRHLMPTVDGKILELKTDSLTRLLIN